MKKYFFSFLILICLRQVSNAQISNTALSINSNPTAVLSDWANDKSVMTYVVTTQKALQFPVVIKAELKLADGTVVATKDLAKAEKINLGQGTYVYYASDIMPLDIMIFNGSYKTTFLKTGNLPAGSYQVSVRFVNAGTYEQVSEVQTKFFNLMALQLPVLIKPANNDTLKFKEAQSAIIFRWTPVTPISKPLPFYHIQVFEILANQNTVQALRSNQPLLDETISAVTQYIWRPQTAFIEDSLVKSFIWTIQTLDTQGKPLIQTDGNGEGRSEPMVFYVRSH